MSIEIRREECLSLVQYAAISCAFDVHRRIVPVLPEPLGRPLKQVDVIPPLHKDYDAIPGNDPTGWPACFTIDRAQCLAAFHGNQRIGGAVVIVDPADVAKLDGHAGAALLWDLRVAPAMRGHGIGRALLAGAELAARDARTTRMLVETQDINVAACELYLRAGYVLERVTPYAYPGLPDEVQLIWSKPFERPLPSG